MAVVTSLDKEQRKTLPKSFDYVIAGAGSAGCVVARRLLEETGSAKILVIEAGASGEGAASISDPSRWAENIGSQHDWGYTYEPNPHTGNRVLPAPRGKVLGGSGSTNASVWARGHRADYDGWAAAGNAGWDYESVLPLFKRSEDWEDGQNAFRGAGGPIRVERGKDLHLTARALIEAGRSYGMPHLDDINVPEPEGVGPLSFNIRDGARCSSWSAYLRPLVDNPNLTLLTEAQAVRLTFSGTRCTGADVLMDGGLYPVAASRHVILAAGAIGTPRLLLLSGVGPHEDLKAIGIKTVINLPGVGRNLQDHVLVAGLCFEAKHPLPARANRTGSVAFWKSRSGINAPDLMIAASQRLYASAEIVAQYSIPKNAFSIVPCLTGVQSRGYLRLKTAAHDGPLEIQPNFLAEEADAEALITGIELGLDIASQPAFRDLIKSWAVPVQRMNRAEAKAFLRLACTSYFHPAGTCAMGAGPGAVVDAKLRVHGTSGLSIADASVMPTIVSANTNAACVMIGEFAAQMMAGG